MKRILSWLLLAVLFCALIPMAWADNQPKVIDQAGLLTQQERQTLEARAGDIIQAYQTDVVILTVDSIGGLDAQTYADDYYDQNDYGIGADRSGILLLVSMEYRDWAISTCGQAIALMGHAQLSRLEDALLPKLSGGDYAGAFQSYLTAMEQILSASSTQESKGLTTGKVLQTLLVGLFLGAAAGGIVILVLRRGMHTARGQRAAHSYVVPDSFQLARSRDIFLFSTMNRVKRQTEQNHTGGSRGGGVHTNHSGTSHGGSHGKF